MAQTAMLGVAPAEQLPILYKACTKDVKERLLSSRVPSNIWCNSRWHKHHQPVLWDCWLGKEQEVGLEVSAGLSAWSVTADEESVVIAVLVT